MSLVIPASGQGGMKWAKPHGGIFRKKEAKVMRLVTLKNATGRRLPDGSVEGGVTVRWSYRNEENIKEDYQLNPCEEMDVEYKVMMHVLGDPDLRPGQTNPPTHGTVKTWEVQIQNLQHRFGAWTFDKSHFNGVGELPGRVVYDESSVFEQIRKGIIYSPEVVAETGLKGPDYYSGADRVPKPKHVSSRELQPDDAVASARRPARVSSRYVEEDEMIAVRREAEKVPLLTPR